MTDDTTHPVRVSSGAAQESAATFHGGRITSDGGVMLLAEAERRLGIAALLAAGISDGCDARRVTHTLADLLRARIFAIACGYEDPDDPYDLGSLRFDSAFKFTCGRLPGSGRDLCCHPTVSCRRSYPHPCDRLVRQLWRQRTRHRGRSRALAASPARAPPRPNLC